MRQEVERTDTSGEHLKQCQTKLNILLEQQKDLSSAIDQLIFDIESGNKYEGLQTDEDVQRSKPKPSTVRKEIDHQWLKY